MVGLSKASRIVVRKGSGFFHAPFGVAAQGIVRHACNWRCKAMRGIFILVRKVSQSTVGQGKARDI